MPNAQGFVNALDTQPTVGAPGLIGRRPGGAYLTADEFGAAPGKNADQNTASIQEALDEASALGGGIVTLGLGQYDITSLELPSFVVLTGIGGPRRTILNATADGSGALISIAAGPVQLSGIRNMRISGQASLTNFTALNASQWAMDAQATVDSTSTGGLWYFSMENVWITGFNNGVRMVGGSTGANLPNQFITFRNVWMDLQYAANSLALDCRGQMGQFSWEGGLCQRRNSANRSGTLVSLGSSGETNRPNNVSFRGVTFQHSDKAITTYNVLNLTVQDRCWFEAVYKCVELTATSTAAVNGNYFANAGSDGASGGYLLSAGSSCRASFKDNTVAGAYDTAIVGTNAYGVTQSGNIYTSAPLVAYSTACAKQIAAAATLDLNSWPVVHVNSSATNITTINTNLGVGESLYIVAQGGTIVFATGGNINLAGVSSPLTLTSGATAHFTVTDLGGRALRLVGTSA